MLPQITRLVMDPAKVNNANTSTSLVFDLTYGTKAEKKSAEERASKFYEDHKQQVRVIKTFGPQISHLSTSAPGKRFVYENIVAFLPRLLYSFSNEYEHHKKEARGAINCSAWLYVFLRLMRTTRGISRHSVSNQGNKNLTPLCCTSLHRALNTTALFVAADWFQHPKLTFFSHYCTHSFADLHPGTLRPGSGVGFGKVKVKQNFHGDRIHRHAHFLFDDIVIHLVQQEEKDDVPMEASPAPVQRRVDEITFLVYLHPSHPSVLFRMKLIAPQLIQWISELLICCFDWINRGCLYFILFQHLKLKLR